MTPGVGAGIDYLAHVLCDPEGMTSKCCCFNASRRLCIYEINPYAPSTVYHVYTRFYAI